MITAFLLKTRNSIRKSFYFRPVKRNSKIIETQFNLRLENSTMRILTVMIQDVIM